MDSGVLQVGEATAGARRLNTYLMKGNQPGSGCRCLGFERDDGRIGVFVFNRSKKSDAPVAIERRGQFPGVTAPKQVGTAAVRT